jgi:hypothetical protein
MTLGKALTTAKSVSSSEHALARMREAGVEVVVRSTPVPWRIPELPADLEAARARSAQREEGALGNIDE